MNDNVRLTMTMQSCTTSITACRKYWRSSLHFALMMQSGAINCATDNRGILTSMHCIVYSKELYCLNHLNMMRPSMIQVMMSGISVRESTDAAAAVTVAG